MVNTISRRDALKGLTAIVAAPLIGLFGGSLVGYVSGCNSNKESYKEQSIGVQKRPESYERAKPQKAEKSEYTLEDFKRTLGEKRLKGITEEGEKKLRGLFESNDPEAIFSRNLICDVYSGKSVKELEFPEKYKQNYELFNPDLIEERELNALRNRVPWKIEKINGRYEEADRKMIYVLEKINEGISDATAEWFAQKFMGMR